jgi:glyoxylase-like metal-dependent hydrolase (beta-lactamase superfamily II)
MRSALRSATRRVVAGLAAGGLVLGLRPGVASIPAQTRPQPVAALRLYVLSLGKLSIPDPRSFGFSKDQLATTDLSVTGYLIVHPKGTLIWDTGVVPDADVGSGGRGTERAEGHRLKDELAKAGYEPSDITHVAISHYHSDHTANLNYFGASTWLVRKAERDPIFAEKPPAIVVQSHFAALRNARTTIIDTDEYDVFGDGSVVIKSTPGHTPGHQVLVLRLPKSGMVVLAGDLYHYPEERKARTVVPTFEFDREQSISSRTMIEEYVARNRAQLWIEHDYANDSKLKKAPAFYE